MDSWLVKSMLKACFLAKKITEFMPPLPDNMRPRYLHVIEAIHDLHAGNRQVRVSDVSAVLNVTTPSITKLINELQDMGMVEKETMKDDKRVTLLKLTEEGKKFHNTHTSQMISRFTDAFNDLDEAECKAMIRTIRQMYTIMIDMFESKQEHTIPYLPNYQEEKHD